RRLRAGSSRPVLAACSPPARRPPRGACPLPPPRPAVRAPRPGPGQCGAGEDGGGVDRRRCSWRRPRGRRSLRVPAEVSLWGNASAALRFPKPRPPKGLPMKLAALLVLALAPLALAQGGKSGIDPDAKAFIDKSRAALKDLKDLSCT